MGHFKALSLVFMEPTLFCVHVSFIMECFAKIACIGLRTPVIDSGRDSTPVCASEDKLPASMLPARLSLFYRVHGELSLICESVKWRPLDSFC